MLKFGIVLFFIIVSVSSNIMSSNAEQGSLEHNTPPVKQNCVKVNAESDKHVNSEKILGIESSTFWSSVGAALGGFIGVIIFFLFRVLLECLSSRKKFVRNYFCGNELNQGHPSESEGELMHHHGRRLVAAEELQKFDVDHPVWEWTKDPVGRGQGDSVVYGPYTTDFEEPGLYAVVFRIRGIGLSRPKEIMQDRILFEFDVSSTIPQYTPVQNTIVTVGALRKVSRQYIRISNLSVGAWTDFEMKFFSDGQGIWEYRILAYDGSGGRPDNISELGNSVRFIFDKVSIFRLKTFRLPWV